MNTYTFRMPNGDRAIVTSDTFEKAVMEAADRAGIRVISGILIPEATPVSVARANFKTKEIIQP